MCVQAIGGNLSDFDEDSSDEKDTMDYSGFNDPSRYQMPKVKTAQSKEDDDHNSMKAR